MKSFFVCRIALLIVADTERINNNFADFNLKRARVFIHKVIRNFGKPFSSYCAEKIRVYISFSVKRNANYTGQHIFCDIQVITDLALT